MTDSSKSVKGDEQGNTAGFAALRINHNESATVHSARLTKTVKSAPTSATVVRNVKRSSSLTVIYMDELQNVTTAGVSEPTEAKSKIPTTTFTKPDEVVASDPNVKHHLVSMQLPLPIARKQSQVAPTTFNQSESTPLEEIAITERTTALPIKGNVTESVESGGLKSPESLEKSGKGLGNPQSVGNQRLDEQGSEVFEEVCRICHDNPSRMTLLSPCLCKVHRTCLERWLGESAKTNCEICGHEYETERRPRYTGWRSVVEWIRNPLTPTDTRNLFFDLACFFILTPLAAISAWLCVVGAKHYSFGQTTLNPEGTNAGLTLVHDDFRAPPPPVRQHPHGKYHNKNMEASNSTWTSIGLLTLTGTLLAAYYVWLFVAVRYHIQVWREWQARNFVVTISPKNPERIRQLLQDAHALVEAAEGHGDLAIEQQQQQQQQSSGHAPNTATSASCNNNNNDTDNFDNTSNRCSVNSNTSSNNYRYQQRKLREKTLARAFEDTLSMESNGTISTEVASQDNHAGPSNFKPGHYSDVDSVQGKVIIIPSEASINIHGSDNTATTTGEKVKSPRTNKLKHEPANPKPKPSK